MSLQPTAHPRVWRFTLDGAEYGDGSYARAPEDCPVRLVVGSTKEGYRDALETCWALLRGGREKP